VLIDAGAGGHNPPAPGSDAMKKAEERNKLVKKAIRHKLAIWASRQ
jgi:hypothetical protein